MSKRLRPGPVKELREDGRRVVDALEYAEAGYRQAIEQACDFLTERAFCGTAEQMRERLTLERGLYEEEKPDLAVELMAVSCNLQKSQVQEYEWAKLGVERLRAALKRRGIEG